MVAGASQIVAEHDVHNSASHELPSVLPIDVCSEKSQLFTASFQQQRIGLRQAFSNDEIEKNEARFQNLPLAYSEEIGFNESLEKAHLRSSLQSFESC